MTIMHTKTARVDFDTYIMHVCHAVAMRATCRHREQGAVVVRDKRILSTGYNGAPPGVKDCLERGYCSKAEDLPCLAEGLHGESNAISTAAKMGVPINCGAMYCIYSPCKACCNQIKTAGIMLVVYEELYDGFPEGPAYLLSLGIGARQHDVSQYEEHKCKEDKHGS